MISQLLSSPLPLVHIAMWFLYTARSPSFCFVWNSLPPFGSHRLLSLQHRVVPLQAKEVGRRVLAGMRPQIPRDCPRRYAALMQQCWDEESDPRPPFDQIIQILQSMQKKKGKGKKKGR